MHYLQDNAISKTYFLLLLVDTSNNLRNDYIIPVIEWRDQQFRRLFVTGTQYDLVHYMTDEAACEERLAELGLRPYGTS